MREGRIIRKSRASRVIDPGEDGAGGGAECRLQFPTRLRGGQEDMRDRVAIHPWERKRASPLGAEVSEQPSRAVLP